MEKSHITKEQIQQIILPLIDSFISALESTDSKTEILQQVKELKQSVDAVLNKQ